MQHPYVNPPLIDIFGPCGTPKEVSQVLNSKFIPPPQCNPLAAKFLSACSCPILIVNVPAHTLSCYCTSWQKSQETTGSLASGIHFGHYITGTFNPEILVVNAALADIPLHTCFTYDCWKKGLNVMIEKTTGDFNVEKLHIILLFEADFNANNKWLGCAIMFQAEKENLLADEQFGSQKSKSAIHQCLNKHLFYDLVRF